MYNYTITWSGFKGAQYQMLPAAIRARNKHGALSALANAIKDNALGNMPAIVKLAVTGRSHNKVAGVITWRAVGPR